MNNNENCDACDASTGRGISYFEVKTATTSELNSIIEHDNLENNSKKQNQINNECNLGKCVVCSSFCMSLIYSLG